MCHIHLIGGNVVITNKGNYSFPFSFSNNQDFRAVPPAYPPNSPLLATTLWQGMMIINGLW